MNDLQKVQLTLRNRWFLNFFSRLDKHWHARSSVGSLRTPSIYRSNCYPLRSFDLEWPRERERTRARAREIQEPALHTHRNNASRSSILPERAIYPSSHPSRTRRLSLYLSSDFFPPFPLAVQRYIVREPRSRRAGRNPRDNKRTSRAFVYFHRMRQTFVISLYLGPRAQASLYG